ncbi:MAG TPA: outer membrane protein assembly factor BamE [Steroidobacteraceae bacterium]|nr:outer membrane protein assembly factor BamE [Steroidobacteraceae bacterium]
MRSTSSATFDRGIRAHAGRLLGALMLALLLPLGGCVYRMNIQQGNFLEKRVITQVKVGMTRNQVRYLLGTPMVPSTFDIDRWDYLYYMKKGRLHRPQRYLLTVFFQNDKVARIDDHGQAPIDSEPTPNQPEPRHAT